MSSPASVNDATTPPTSPPSSPPAPAAPPPLPQNPQRAPRHDLEDVHVQEMMPVAPPRYLKEVVPAPPEARETVLRSRETIRRIQHREDPRLLVVVGPCSIHDTRAAWDYAQRLNEAREKYRETLFLVMRTYFEKPRTTIGWRGLINDPYLDGSHDMTTGLRWGRELLTRITRLGLPVAVEMLDPVTPQYFSDLISWAAIGARTTESQTHRALASGLSMPVGFKNGTDGGLQIAIDAMVSARHGHSFLGVDQEGRGMVVKTTGNPDTFLILRGGKQTGPNYDAQSVARAEAQISAAGLEPAVVVDCSHGNSGKDPAQQVPVWESLVAQRAAGNSSLFGAMIESNLASGNQPLPKDFNGDLSRLQYGVSVTDACVDWTTTETMLEQAHHALKR